MGDASQTAVLHRLDLVKAQAESLQICVSDEVFHFHLGDLVVLQTQVCDGRGQV